MQKEVVCGSTGPNGGLTQLDLHSDEMQAEEVAGIQEWNTPNDFAYGLSLSLYEEDTTKTKVKIVNGVAQSQPHIVGGPIADVYGAVVRKNNTILAVADGCNWGKKPRLAARCAVRTAIEFISEHIDHINQNPTSTILAEILMKSVDEAHKCILQHHATLTTLSIAVVCQLTPGKSAGEEQWGLFVASVGDSPVYTYCPRTQRLMEMTIGCHPHNGIRDMKTSGGALGPAIGTLPDLENLSISFMSVYNDDIVILMSDGVSDNFSSHVIQPLLPEEERMCSPPSPNTSDFRVHIGTLPQSTCCDNVTQLEAVLNRHNQELQHNMSAQTISACLMNVTVELTEAKRQFRSHCIEEDIDIRTKLREDPQFAECVKQIPGKLDHATVLSYQVGKNRFQ